MNTNARQARRQSDLLSIDALKQLLEEMSATGRNHARAEHLREFLRSQGALANFSDKDLGILSMSLNHLKAIAELRLGSYDVLDHLRKSALSAINQSDAKAVQGGMETKESLKNLVRELSDDRTALLQDLMILQRAYDLRCIQARTYAQCADMATQERCTKEQRELDATFSLRKKTIDSGKITNIEEARGRVRT